MTATDRENDTMIIRISGWVLLIRLLCVFAEGDVYAEKKESDIPTFLPAGLEKEVVRRYELSPSQKRRVRKYRHRFVHGDATLFRDMSGEDFALFRYGNLNLDFLQRHHRRGLPSIRAGIRSAGDMDVRRDLIRFAAVTNPMQYEHVFRKALKTEEDERLRAMLLWGLRQARRRKFISDLRNHGEKILAKISYSEFNEKNGTDYPTALQALNFRAIPLLLAGLQNKDHRLRIYYLMILKNLKTRYNKRKILAGLLVREKTEQHPDVRRMYAHVIAYYRK